MTSRPRVSVVIPVYNAMPYLAETLGSLLDQELRDIEVIAVDDGSTDGSGRELDRVAAFDPRLAVVHQPNSGWPGMPRNRGIERAGGEFVFFMDADDTLAPHALDEMVRMAQEREADIVIPRLDGAGGREVQSLFTLHPHGDITVARAMETLSPQKLFRRELIDRHDIRFPEGAVRLEDGIFVARAYVHARRIAFCGRDPLYFIALRDDGQNISRKRIVPGEYVDSCRRIAKILLQEGGEGSGAGDGDQREILVQEFFLRKGLRFYAPKRWLRRGNGNKREWVAQHRSFLADLVPDRLDERVQHPTDAHKVALIRAGDVEGIDALVAAERNLQHDAVCTGLHEVPGGIEVRVALAPREAGGPLSATGPPTGLRMRAIEAVHRAAAPTLRWHAGRGLSRILERRLAGQGPQAHLFLSGRRVGRPVSVPGRLAAGPENDRGGPGAGPDGRGGTAVDCGDPLHYRFVLPYELLRRFTGDRADLWTIAEAPGGLSGGRERLRIEDAFASDAVYGAGGEGALSHGVRVFATGKGNLSLDLRKPRQG